jgi:hypothetical protein
LRTSNWEAGALAKQATPMGTVQYFSNNGERDLPSEFYGKFLVHPEQHDSRKNPFYLPENITTLQELFCRDQILLQ